MHVLYEFDAYTWVNGGGHKQFFSASVWWTAPTPAVFFCVNRGRDGRVYAAVAEWRVGEGQQENVAQLLAGVAAGAIVQPLSDYLQEAGAPEWVWKGVIDDPDWDDTVPWPPRPAIELSAGQADELVRRYQSFGGGRFVPTSPDRIPSELPSEGGRQ